MEKILKNEWDDGMVLSKKGLTNLTNYLHAKLMFFAITYIGGALMFFVGHIVEYVTTSNMILANIHSIASMLAIVGFYIMGFGCITTFFAILLADYDKISKGS